MFFKTISFAYHKHDRHHWGKEFNVYESKHSWHVTVTRSSKDDSKNNFANISSNLLSYFSRLHKSSLP